MIAFGLESRALAGALILCALTSYLALHEYKEAAIADTRCGTRLAVQVSDQNTATATDQHKADVDNIKRLQDQIARLQSDSEQAAARQTRLQAKLDDQQKVSHDLRKHAKPGDCLTVRIPDALPDSLYPGNQAATQPPG